MAPSQKDVFAALTFQKDSLQAAIVKQKADFDQTLIDCRQKAAEEQTAALLHQDKQHRAELLKRYQIAIDDKEKQLAEQKAIHDAALAAEVARGDALAAAIIKQKEDHDAEVAKLHADIEGLHGEIAALGDAHELDLEKRRVHVDELKGKIQWQLQAHEAELIRLRERDKLREVELANQTRAAREQADAAAAAEVRTHRAAIDAEKATMQKRIDQLMEALQVQRQRHEKELEAAREVQ